MAYVFIFYVQISASIATHNNALFQKTKSQVTEALVQFSEYLTLTEARLLKSQENKRVLAKIISEKPENVLGRSFPTIIDIAFTPASNPSLVYTRFGNHTLNQATTLKNRQEGIVYLGNNKFRLEKVIYDKNQKKVGVIRSTFSIEHILDKNFPEKEIHVVSAQGHNLSNKNFYFTVKNFPYAFIGHLSPPNFWQFLCDIKFQVLIWMIFSCAIFLMGEVAGSLLSSKLLMKSRAQAKKSDKRFKIEENAKEILQKKFDVSQNLLKLKDFSQREILLLVERLLTNYQQMAGQAQAINKMTSKLISEAAENNEQMKEILKVSEDSNAVLTFLINGFPMKAVEESVDILKCLENIKMIFLPKITEMSVQFKIKGEIKSPVHFDKTIVEIVLHNIFYIIIDRLAMNSTFEIELKDQDSMGIIFRDNGYDLMGKSHWARQHQNMNNIFFMDKKRLQNFISWLGWKILFKTEEDLNIIELSIPRALKNDAINSNVINLFDFNSHAK